MTKPGVTRQRCPAQTLQALHRAECNELAQRLTSVCLTSSHLNWCRRYLLLYLGGKGGLLDLRAMESLRLISTSFRTEYKKTPLQLKVRLPSITHCPAGAHRLGPDLMFSPGELEC